MPKYEYKWVNWNEERLTRMGSASWRVVPGIVDNGQVLMEREKPSEATTQDP